jgi:hypothetical protein
MHKSDAWLAPMLERELGRVTPPDELWNRIHWPRAQPFATSNPNWLTLALVMGLVIVMAALSFRPSPSIHSGQPAQIRSWVKTNAGLDVALRRETSTSAVLEHAQVIRGEPPAAEIGFRIGSRPGMLRVSKMESAWAAVGQHATWSNNARVVSWGMRGQLYTLSCASPEDLKAACLLCHT